MPTSQHRAANGKIIVSGILFWYPLAGVTYQFLHYLIALKKLGFDPYYIEDAQQYVYDPFKNDLAIDPMPNIRRVLPMLERHGFADRWAFRGVSGEWFGMTASQVQQHYLDAEALLNVTGQHVGEDHLKIKHRIYIESDPFAAQVKAEQGDDKTVAQLDAHHVLFSFGENIGAPDCGVPNGRYAWLPTRQPVEIDLWQGPVVGSPSRYRTITTWKNEGKDVVYRGETYYWTKDREFLKFIDLPKRRRGEFEMAVRAPDDVSDVLLGNGWILSDPVAISQDCATYRDFIRASRGEFTIARDQYVRPKTGWFSDRTACYLAAGKPVITQETGFGKYLPVGEGLYAFETMEDILTAVDDIESDYERACRGALSIAREYFAADRVVKSILERAW